MNTFQILCKDGKSWIVNHYKDGILAGQIGPCFASEAEALFAAYRLGRAQILDREAVPAWEDIREDDPPGTVDERS